MEPASAVPSRDAQGPARLPETVASVTPLTVTIISCQQRHAARALTVPQLQAATGVEPTVILSPCDAERPAGNRENAIASGRAHDAALAAGGDWLFCEDDIDLAADFPRFLTLARATGRVTYLYAHDIPHRMPARYGAALTRAILEQQPIPAGLIRVPDVRTLRGSQCIYIPKSLLDATSFGTLKAGQSSFDVWFARHLENTNTDTLLAVPHPVQHRQDRTARKHPASKSPDKYSRSFDLERRWVS